MMVKKKNTRIRKMEDQALKLTRWIGTPVSIIIHTILFISAFVFYFFGVEFDTILLVLTTIVSLEAIYLSLFIQLSVNKNTESLEDVEEDIEEIQEDVEGLEGEFEEIAEDFEGLEGNIVKLRKNMQELGQDIGEIQEDVGELNIDDQSEEELAHIQSNKSLKNIEKEILTLSSGIIALRDDLEILKKNIK